jgi:hypothetical protein
MARDLEVIESDSKSSLESKVQDFIKGNAEGIANIQYASYTDFETKETVYIASIFLN